MGIVYRGRQRRPDRIVAIKVIAPELAADRDFRARFEQESAVAAQIEHPNVIPVYEVGEEQGQVYITMRYVEGVDLGQLLQESGPLEPARAAHLISQVAGALDAAHARGLVHRDVKPGNILVAAGDNVYLTDFGLTKRISDTRGLTRTGMFVGTVDYIAPEAIESRPLDARADVYALGCVLYELLSGTVPFPRDSEISKLYAHVNDPPPPLHGVPPAVAAAVARAMAKDPEDRFASAGGFARAVLAAAGPGQSGRGAKEAIPTAIAPTVAAPGAGSATELAPAETAPPRARPRARGRGASNRVWVAAGVVMLVLIVGGGLAFALSSGGSKSPPKIVSHPHAHSSGGNATGNTSRPILAPATVPPNVGECNQQLQFGADGTAGPVKCANGDVNALDWQFIAHDGHTKILSLGPFATPQQALQAMCADHSSTIPLEDQAYQLAQTYYGWQFGVDPTASYPSSCPSG